MGKKHRKEVALDDGWTGWIAPRHERYQMSCCDCGLVHTLQFRVVEGESGWMPHNVEAIVDGARVIMKVKRDNRATAQIRRHMRRK